MDYFYHYTKFEYWEKIRQEGLKPGKPIGRGARGSKCTHELASKPVTFGFVSPAPESWTTYNLNRPSAADPHSLLAYLLKCIGDGETGVALLKIRLQPNDDIYVGEYKNIWEAFDAPTDDAPVNKYCQSVMKQQDGSNAFASMVLPEILCFSTIPTGRIELVEKMSAKTYEEINAYIEAKKT